jgi:hypothetical protein
MIANGDVDVEFTALESDEIVERADIDAEALGEVMPEGMKALQ